MWLLLKLISTNFREREKTEIYREFNGHNGDHAVDEDNSTV